MTTTYTEALITDEATDADSPLNETLMQGIARGHNYVNDALFDGGGNSERIGMTLFNYADDTSTLFAASEANMDTDFYIYIPTQYDGVDVAFRAVVDFSDADLDSADAVVLTIGTGSDTETEGGSGGAARAWTGTITPGSTGLVLCNMATTGIATSEVLRVNQLLIYIAST